MEWGCSILIVGSTDIVLVFAIENKWYSDIALRNFVDIESISISKLRINNFLYRFMEHFHSIHKGIASHKGIETSLMMGFTIKTIFPTKLAHHRTC